jgi:hypothetical protein
MLSTMDILSVIEEQETHDRHLAKKLEIELQQLKKILMNLSKHNIIEYNVNNGKVKLRTWLVNINEKIENARPGTGTVILPKNQEIKLQDITIGNFTDQDLELNVRLGIKQREIAICKIT